MADQIDRLVFDVVGRDRNGTKVLKDASTHADAAHHSFRQLGSTLSGIGGPFEQVTNLAGNLGDAMEGSLGRVQKLGLGLTATGVALIGFAAHDQQAHRQLQQSISNTGAAYGDYREEIEQAIHTQEGYAHSAADTQDALSQLTTATQDPKRALDELGVVADIAAAKHIGLADASRLLTLAQEGNLRALRSFGISLDGNGTKAAQLNRALRQLQDRLSGQASASVDTFAGRLKISATRLEDNLAQLGKYGPEVTAAGAALTIYASIQQVSAARKLAEVAATEAETKAEVANAAARTATAEAATAEAVAVQRATIVQGEAAAVAGGRGSLLGRFGKGAGVAVGGYYASQLAGQAVGGSSGRYLSDIGGGAAVGAGLGSVVPGVGTAVGAGVGATVGAISAYMHSQSDGGQAKNVATTEASYKQLQARLVQFQKVAANTSGMEHDLAEKVVKQAKSALEASKATHEYATALLKEKTAAAVATDSLDKHLKALENNAKHALDVRSAEDGLQGAMHNLAQSVFDGSRALHGHSLAAASNRAALRDLASQEMNVIDAMKADHVGRRRIIAAAEAMSRALINNAGAVLHNRGAVRALLRELGLLPPQIARALGGAEAMSELVGEQIMRAEAAGIDAAAPIAVQAAQRAAGQIAAAQAQKGLRLGDSADGGGAAASYTPKADLSAKKYGKHLADTVVGSFAPAVDTGVDDAAKKALDAARERLRQQREYERQTFQDVSNFYHQTRNQIVGGFDVTNLPTRTDSLGSAFGHGSLAHEARQFVHDLETWANLLGRLRRRGLNQVMLDQFEQAGVAAIPAMREVLRSHEIGALNRAERRIGRIASGVATTVTQDEYGREIYHAMQKLPDRLARKLAHELARLNIITDTAGQDHKQGQRVYAG